MRRLRIAVGLLLCVSALSLPPASASHFMQAAQAVQFNIWGYKEGAGYNSAIATDIITSIRDRNPRPLTISLNEVCNGQYTELINALDDYGYVGFLTWSRGGESGAAAVNTTNCSQFGNALLWLGGAADYSLGYFAHNPRLTIERRNWACGKGAYPSFWSCTAHMDVADADARIQLDEYRQKVDPYRTAGHGLHAAGDFNIDGRTSGSLNYARLTSWYQYYRIY